MYGAFILFVKKEDAAMAAPQFKQLLLYS